MKIAKSTFIEYRLSDKEVLALPKEQQEELFSKGLYLWLSQDSTKWTDLPENYRDKLIKDDENHQKKLIKKNQEVINLLDDAYNKILKLSKKISDNEDLTASEIRELRHNVKFYQSQLNFLENEGIRK